MKTKENNIFLFLTMVGLIGCMAIGFFILTPIALVVFAVVGAIGFYKLYVGGGKNGKGD